MSFRMVHTERDEEELAIGVSGVLALGHWTVNRTVHGVVSPTTATRPGDYSDTVVSASTGSYDAGIT